MRNWVFWDKWWSGSVTVKIIYTWVREEYIDKWFEGWEEEMLGFGNIVEKVVIWYVGGDIGWIHVDSWTVWGYK